MLITSYNRRAFGDTLIAILGPDQQPQTVSQQGDVVGIFAGDTALGFNFHHVAQWGVTGLTDGQVFLSESQIASLNAALAAAGFTTKLAADTTPKLVIGKVLKLTPHPDSDHLQVAQVDLGARQVQIVCGAPNVAAGQTVVAAIPGAMMPNGQLIWPGQLRGVDSYGMLCAARELAIPGAPQRRGILIMPDDLPAGRAFDPTLAEQVVAAQN